LGMSLTMWWRRKPENQPNAELGGSEDNAQYRWDDGSWRVPPYKHWEAGNSDYQADERRFWGRQVWAMSAGVGVGIATLIAAIIAAKIAYWAYGETVAAVIEARKQTIEAQKQTIQAQRQAAAAEAQIAIARDTEEVQLRTYLFVRPKNLNPPNVASVTPTVAFHFHIVGTGATPATSISTHAIAHDFPYPLPEPFDLPLDYVTEKVAFSLGEVMPTESPDIDPIYLPLDRQGVLEFGNNKRIAFVYGVLGYFDAFGQYWVVEYCYLYDWLAISQTGNSKICPWHNERKRDELKPVKAADMERLIRERPKTRRVPSFTLDTLTDPKAP
jgi:hypothetical protein